MTTTLPVLPDFDPQTHLTQLQEGCSTLGITLSASQLAQFEAYFRGLVEWNERFNLTAITDYIEVQIKHFLDSVIRHLTQRTPRNQKGRNRLGLAALPRLNPRIDGLRRRRRRGREILVRECIGRSHDGRTTNGDTNDFRDVVGHTVRSVQDACVDLVANDVVEKSSKGFGKLALV